MVFVVLTITVTWLLGDTVTKLCSLIAAGDTQQNTKGEVTQVNPLVGKNVQVAAMWLSMEITYTNSSDQFPRTCYVLRETLYIFYVDIDSTRLR